MTANMFLARISCCVHCSNRISLFNTISSIRTILLIKNAIKNNFEDLETSLKLQYVRLSIDKQIINSLISMLKSINLELHISKYTYKHLQINTKIKD